MSTARKVWTARLTLLGCAVVTWAYVALRALPDIRGDAGTYLSMAARLDAGDILYTQVWDNKEPFFYLGLAASRLVAPAGPYFLELAYLAVAAASAAAIARSAGVSDGRAGLVGLVLAPLLLTGTSYEPLMSHLPGSALTLAAVACALRGRATWAGLAVGLIVLLKVTSAPVAGLMVVAILLPRWGLVWRAVVGGCVGLGAEVAVLVARHEFAGTLSTLAENVSYASSPDLVSGPPLLSHLVRLERFGLALVPAVVLLAVLITLLVRRLSAAEAGARIAPLVRASVVGFVAGLAVLSLTALWPHHAQVLLPPMVVAVAALVAAVRRPRDWVGIATVCALVVGGGLLIIVRQADSLPERWREINARASVEAQALVGVHPRPGRYARLGNGDLVAHARGLESWALACPRFAEYPFTPPATLTANLECVLDSDVVLVAASFAEQPDRPEWNTFVRAAQAGLAARFDCAAVESGRVCVARPGG